jgi:hypothetical protein
MWMSRLVVVIFVLAACGNDPDYVIPPTTKIADTATKAALSEVNEDSLVFSKSTGVLDSLAVGDILNSDITELAPGGLLRKITGIDRSGGRVTLQTVQGTLGEAIERGSFQFQKTIAMEDIADAMARTRRNEGPLSSTAPIITFDRGINLGFDDFGANFSSPGDVSVGGSIGLDGHLRLNPILSMTGDIRNFHVYDFEISLEFEGDSDLQISTDLNLAIEKSTDIYTLTLTAITIPIGPFVIVLVPVLIFKVGIAGSIALSMSFHEVGSFDGLTGTHYNDTRGWTSLNRGSSEGMMDNLPTFGLSAAIDAYVGVQADVRLYNVLSGGPTFTVKFGPSLDFETPRDPFLIAGLRIVANLGLHLAILGREFGSVTLAEYNELFPIFSSPNTSPNLAITSPPNNQSYAPGQPIHFQAAVYDLEDGTSVPLTWTSSLDGVIGTGSDFTSTMNPTAPGTRTITATAVDSAELPRAVDFQLTITNPGPVPVIAEPRATQSLYTYNSVVRGSATSGFFPGVDLCGAGFTYDWASSAADTIGPVQCNLGSARATITYVGTGPRTLTFGVTDPFGVRTTTTRLANVVDPPTTTFFGSNNFSSPAPSSSFSKSATVLINATADPRKVVTDPYPFQAQVPLTFTFSATSYAADGVTEIATVDIGSKVETDKTTAGTGVTPALAWVPGNTPGFIDPTIAAMGTGQKVVLSFTAIDYAGHLGTATLPILVTP